jgi:predicted DNA-binding transcriptional regulator YafY
MNDACYRRIQTLKLIPQFPSRISLSSMHGHLTAQGFDIDKRSLQRDVKGLSKLFEIESDGNKDIPGWYWNKDAEKLVLPEMEPAVALSFNLVKLFLDRFMPPSTLEDLSGHFQHAEKILSSLSTNHLSNWSGKVALVSRNQPLLAPTVHSDVLNTVYTALLSETQIKAHYQPRNQEPRDYTINPLGIVVVDQIIYLVCTLWEYPDIKQLALHRFGEAELLATSIIPQPDFSLEKYIHEGAFEYLIDDGEENKIRLVAKVNKSIAKHLSESRLSDTQRLEATDNEMYLLEATVKNTQQLRWWILGFGDGIEVIEPLELREEFVVIAKELNSMYSPLSGNPEDL